MGIAGHIGIAFEPADETLAIAVFTGGEVAPDGDDWVKYQTSFDLVREDWWEMHHTLKKLADHDPSLEPLSSLLLGKHSIGEGPGTDFFLFRAHEVQAIAEAFAGVTDVALDRAIAEALCHSDFKERNAHDPDYVETYRNCLPKSFVTMARDMAAVAEGGWAMIGAMV